MPNIALVDPEATSGHHLAFMTLLSKVLLQLGCRVSTFFPEPDRLFLEVGQTMAEPAVFRQLHVRKNLYQIRDRRTFPRSWPERSKKLL